MRYEQLNAVINSNKPQRIVEVGTWNGDRAIQMCMAALQHHESVHYTGFDLFEDATDETDESELNVKAHFAIADVEEKLKELPNVTFDLVKGNTRETLPKHVFTEPIDFAFIDGGHSVETIKSDFEALSTAKVLVLDDFYTDRDISEFGCNKLVENLKHEVLPAKDPVLGGGFVQMVQIGGEPPMTPLTVRTQNSVPDEEIIRNVEHFLTKDIEMADLCEFHNEVAVVVNGGADYKNHLDEIRDAVGERVIVSKHVHDFIIEKGIIPYGCFLLDPRDHVKNYVSNPHPDVTYFVASQCHPTTLNHMLEKKARILGYHAAVGAGEMELVAEWAKENKKTANFIQGGSTSTMRGVGLLFGLGFRTFKLYGFDCCYWPYEDLENLKVGYKGKPEYMEVTLGDGRKFTTDAENLALAQDFERFVKQEHGVKLDVRGDGIIPHVWKSLNTRTAIWRA